MSSSVNDVLRSSARICAVGVGQQRAERRVAVFLARLAGELDRPPQQGFVRCPFTGSPSVTRPRPRGPATPPPGGGCRRGPSRTGRARRCPRPASAAAPGRRATWSSVPSPARRSGPVTGVPVSRSRIRGRERGHRPVAGQRSGSRSTRSRNPVMVIRSGCHASPSSHRPAQPGVAVPAEPQRDRAGAVVVLVGPGGADRPEVLVGELPALLERHAERGELLLRPADAGAEHQPAAAERVEVGRHPGDQQRMAVRHDQHRGAQPHPLGDARPARTAS